MGDSQISFGPFTVDLGERQLWRDGRPVRLAGRALDILCVLAAAAGAVVTKDELMARLWSGRVVEEGNIHVHVSKLRTVLGDQGDGHNYIVTVPRRGYRLIAASAQPTLAAPGPSDLPLPDKPSIAVLPFQNLSGEPQQEFFADGIVAELITALSSIRSLFVIARSSSFTYKNQLYDVKRVGRELGVRYLLEGSVRRTDHHVRIAACLIDAETGVHRWAESFDGSLEDVFGLQKLVASSVAGVIEPAVQAAEIWRSFARPTDDLTAYDFYLRALPDILPLGRTTAFQALELLEQAVERDPRFGAALALASWWRLQIAVSGWTEEPRANRRTAIDLGRRALQLAGDDPTVLADVAGVLGGFGEDIDFAVGLIDRALALNPNSALAWHWSGWLRLALGEADLAVIHFQKSLRLDPRSPTLRPFYSTGVAIAHFSKRRFQEAAPLLIAARQQLPSYVTACRYFAACYAHLGRQDDAADTLGQLKAITPAVLPGGAGHRNAEIRELLVSGLRLAAGGAS